MLNQSARIQRAFLLQRLACRPVSEAFLNKVEFQCILPTGLLL